MVKTKTMEAHIKKRKNIEKVSQMVEHVISNFIICQQIHYSNWYICEVHV